MLPMVAIRLFWAALLLGVTLGEGEKDPSSSPTPPSSTLLTAESVPRSLLRQRSPPQHESDGNLPPTQSMEAATTAIRTTSGSAWEGVSIAKDRSMKVEGEMPRGRRLDDDIDSSSSSSTEGTTSKPKDQPVRVYVYDDIPELDFSPVIECFRRARGGLSPWLDERSEMAQNMGEIWYHRAFLAHPWRVLDPEQADLFYVPTYAVLSALLARTKPEDVVGQYDVSRCDGLRHVERMDAAVTYLLRESQFFNRYGGADHLVVCAWWDCRHAFNPWQRMILRRTILGINQWSSSWSRWGCGVGRLITVPYTASSVVTTPDNLFGLPPKERDVSFFFAGSSRHRPQRENLVVVQDLVDDSVIVTGSDPRSWGMNHTEYAATIVRSRFCFCPKGDSSTSRRFFDAIAAGCIPIITEDGHRNLPYDGIGLRFGLNYYDFCIVVKDGSFDTREGVANIARDILARPDEDVARLQLELRTAGREVLYGETCGGEIDHMFPFIEPATKLLQAGYTLAGGATGEVRQGHKLLDDQGMNMWYCSATDLPVEQLALRTQKALPPPEGFRRQYLRESETIMNQERSLLLCAPPHTGSLQIRMLAKRMQGISHWSVSNDRSLLFDRSFSELELLDIEDGPLLEQIYSENGSGWIKIGVVRDPVTRLVSAYLGLVRSWRAGLMKLHEQYPQRQDPQRQDHGRQLLRKRVEDEEKTYDSQGGHRREGLGSAGGDVTAAAAKAGAGLTERELVALEIEEAEPSFLNGAGGWDGPASPSASEWTDEERRQYTGEIGIQIPTFPEVLKELRLDTRNAPSMFQPVANLCGQRSSPFDSVIPFERLQKTSMEVLMSLTGNVWEEFGQSGWGPNGEHAFMEFDYGATPWISSGDADEEGKRAGELFEEDSCAWTEFYPDEETLEMVASIYTLDYHVYGWYKLEPWKERLRTCIDGNRGE